MITIKPYLRTYKKNSSDGVVWISFYVNRQKVNFTTKVSCKVEHWMDSEYRIKMADPSARDKNLIVENIISRINNVFVKYRLRDKTLTRDSFWRAYNRPDDYKTFYEFVDEWKRKHGYKNEDSTNAVHKTVLKKMKEYNSELHFDDITPDWLDDYYSHLIKGEGNNMNTAYKNMSTIRKYVRLAYKARYIEENPFENWKIKRGKASYMYLNENELNAFIKAYTTGQFEYKYHKTLEFFLFMCFSSLHVTDALNLKLEQFNDDSFTYYRIKNRNSKPEPIVVPLSDPLKRIIINVVGTRKKGVIFDNMNAPQTMNDFLKEIAKELEIPNHSKISHKAGRHTFATYFLSKTKDLASLKEILGHSDLRETLIYAHVLDESKREGIKYFDDFKL